MKKQLIITGSILSSILLFSYSEQIRNSAFPLNFDYGPDPIVAYLTPEESMKTMVLPPGYRIELVASEPMIKEPVAIAWDGNAKMYVAEMMTYMQDADASGEQEPTSRISLLEDTDNDGKMDKSTVFIDSLLLPRMIQCVNHELLVNETNTITLHSYKDTNGDGKADVKKVIYKNDRYTLTDRNMEHQRSGLDWNLDNWMYITYDPVRFRYTNGKLLVDTMASGTSGQWGVTHDNYGRLFFSSAGGENPVYGFQINPVYGRLDFPDQFKPEFQEVWPIIPTPDVQGGEKRLRPDNTLNHFTGCSGQSIYRGDKLPQDLVGDYIVCEPVARLIRRAKVKTIKGKTYLENAYDKKEFLASSDMNFRPVNSYTGPDGNLYLVDMHRGIIQQGNWTRPGSFLRKKIDSIGLAKNTGHGRIYRVVYDGFKQGPKPQMLNESSKQLINYLGHGNGWWRDNAQKELIVRGDKSVIPDLKAIIANTTPNAAFANQPLGRIHSIWTLEGLNALDKNTLLKALSDKDPQVRKTAVWASESFIRKNDQQIVSKLASMKKDADDDVRVQLLLSAYQGKSAEAKALVNALVEANEEIQMFTSVRNSLDRNEDQRTYGKKLAHLPQRDISVIINGKNIFKSLCASCHGADGKGLMVGGSKAAPSLIGSKRVREDSASTAIRIVLHGLSGPVDGVTYSSIMPPMGSNNDRWVASVLSYVRYEMAGSSSQRPAKFMVQPEDVRRIRQLDSTRTSPWTLAELATKTKKAT